MRLTIDTDVLGREGLSLGEFLVLLMGFHDVSYKECLDNLVRDGTLDYNAYDHHSMVLSDNVRDMVARLITESDEKVVKSKLDFDSLARKLQEIYPDGNKAGTSYPWRGKAKEIAQKLRVLVARHGFSFTEEEAVKATKEYIGSFKSYDYMLLLKYFILRTKRDGTVDSMFMTIIENIK